ncbi:hypothetical protein V6Z12_A02G046700 [Gossypium hirsutum]
MAVIFPSSERKNAVGTSAQKNRPSNFLIRTVENSGQQSNERNGREMGENTGQEPPYSNFNFEPSIPVVEAVRELSMGYIVTWVKTLIKGLMWWWAMLQMMSL